MQSMATLIKGKWRKTEEQAKILLAYAGRHASPFPSKDHALTEECST